MLKNESQKIFISEILNESKAGRNKEAMSKIKNFLMRNPKNFYALYVAGFCSKNLSKYDDSKKYLNKSIDLLNSIDKTFEDKSLLANCLCILAEIYNIELDTKKAEEYYDLALIGFPNDASLLEQSAIFHHENKKYLNFKKYSNLLVQLNPQNGKANCLFGTALFENGEYDDAEKYLLSSLKLSPKDPTVFQNLALLYRTTKRYLDSLKMLDKLYAINPYFSKFIHSEVLISMGDFENGWKYYEDRDSNFEKDITFSKKLPIPMWNGESLTNKSLLIFKEQGFGDTIQLLRFLPELKKLKLTKIVFVVQNALKKIIQDSEEIIQFDYLYSVKDIENLSDENVEKLKNIDYWICSFSLPYLLKTKVETIPSTFPYLKIDENKSHYWKEKLLSFKTQKIALIWKGNSEHENDRFRSLENLDILKPLFDIKDVDFFSIQKGEKNECVSYPITSLSSEIIDFSDTAAILSQMDLLISIDSAPAHLAGALNIPCFVLLQYHKTDYRWQDSGDTSIWYSSLRLFRQEKDLDWTPVVDKIVIELKKLLDNK